MGAIAGCTGITTQSGDPFDTVAVRGATLRIHLSGDVDEIEVRSPDGSSFLRRQIGSDTKSISLPLIDYGYSSSTYYQAGENTLVARKDGDKIGQQTIDLVPETEIMDMSLPSSSLFNPEVTLENRGSGPTLVTYLGFENVPSPTPPPAETTGMQAGGETGTLLTLDEKTLRSGSMPFAFRKLPSEADDLSCPGQKRVNVVVQTVHNGRVSQEFDVTFGGTIKNVLWLSHRCTNVSIEEA